MHKALGSQNFKKLNGEEAVIALTRRAIRRLRGTSSIVRSHGFDVALNAWCHLGILGFR